MTTRRIPTLLEARAVADGATWTATVIADCKDTIFQQDGFADEASARAAAKAEIARLRREHGGTD